MIQGWKIPHIIKGTLTFVPGLHAWRLRHASTGGTNSARYCYTVWLRLLAMLNSYGIKVKGAHIAELGPGDSIGVGLAALLSGAEQYTGLDVVPFSTKADLEKIFDELVQIFSHRELIHGLDKFPDYAVDWTDFTHKVERIRGELRRGVNSGNLVRYRAPWTSRDGIAASSLNLIFSENVLEYVDALEETYQSLFMWMKPGSYSSHAIAFSASYLSPFWNGHWAYSDSEWRLVRGGRKFLLNREPLTTHLAYIRKVGFEILDIKRQYDNTGLNVSVLSPRFQMIDKEDLRTRRAVLLLKKK